MSKKIKNRVLIRKSLGSAVSRATLNVSLLALGLFCGSTSQASDLIFKMELSKSEIFVGEQTFCNFVVYTNEEVVNVEVEKFPDFRGYWKDNLVLRQGPIPTAITPAGNFRKAIIGSYLITPMVGNLEPLIDPMKIVIRDPLAAADSKTQRTAVSEGKPPVIKPLPAINDPEKAKFFHGAVGSVTLSVDKTIFSFTKDEPFLIRFALAGEANFQDLNDLNLKVPPQVEVLSKRSSIQGSGQFFTKVFEYTLAVHRDENLLLDPLQFLVFSLPAKKYVLLESAPIHLQREVAAPIAAEESGEAMPLLPLQTRPTPYRSWNRNPWFFALQALLILGLGSVIAVNFYREKMGERSRQVGRLRKVQWKKANADLRAGKVEDFLKAANQLAFEVLREKVPAHKKAATRSELLANVKPSVTDELWQNAQALFNAYDDYLFTPHKKMGADEAALNRSLNIVMKGGA
jgi:hypothetical protein